MSAKRGDDNYDDLEDHTYFDMGTNFLKELAPHVDSQDKVPLKYFGFISGAKIKFERTKLIPSAVLEQAKRDSKFCHNLCYAIALSFREEMLGLGPFVCMECGSSPATEMIQMPFSCFNDDPPRIHDMSVRPVCDNVDCSRKAKALTASFAESIGKVLSQHKTETAAAPPNEKLMVEDLGHFVKEAKEERVCLNCGKTDAKALRCSRCKSAYFCNQQCQKACWPKHKKECKLTATP